MRPKAIIFDLDGTLVDSAPDLHACINALLSELGLDPLDLDLVTSFIGEGIPPLVERSLAAAGKRAGAGALSAAVSRYKQIYGAAPAALTRPYEGVPDCLGVLRDCGWKLGVCTNKAEDLAQRVIGAVGLSATFSAIVGGDTLSVRKPDPRPLLHAANLLSAGTDRTIYVGDSETDAATARAAHIPFVLFTRGYRKTSIEEIASTASFEEFEALPALIERLGSSDGTP